MVATSTDDKRSLDELVRKLTTDEGLAILVSYIQDQPRDKVDAILKSMIGVADLAATKKIDVTNGVVAHFAILGIAVVRDIMAESAERN